MSAKKSTSAITQPPRLARCRIRGVTPITWGKAHTSVKQVDEDPGVFDATHWRERGHWDEQDRAVIPGDIIQKSLVAAGSWLSEKLEGGQGRATFKKRFCAGIRCTKPALVEPVQKRDEVGCWAGMVPSQPTKGKGGGRVLRHFPIIQAPWSAELEVLIIDGKITNDVFVRHLSASGLFDGYGTHRPGSPQSPGSNGTFVIENVTFEELPL